MNYKLLLECQIPFGSEFNNVAQSLKTTTWRRVKMELKFNLESLLPFTFQTRTLLNPGHVFSLAEGDKKLEDEY